MITEQLFIAGRWRPRNPPCPLRIPPTGETIGAMAAGTATDIDAAVAAARKAFNGAWGALNAVERGRIPGPHGQDRGNAH